MVAASKLPLVDSSIVRALAEAKSLRKATILGQPGGWAVAVADGTDERIVAAQKTRAMRLWRHLDSAAAYVRGELGLAQFSVDAANHEPETGRRSRPDTAERQRRAHAAREHDAWFRAEVEKALGEADGADAGWVSHDDVKEAWHRQRAALATRSDTDPRR